MRPFYCNASNLESALNKMKALDVVHCNDDGGEVLITFNKWLTDNRKKGRIAWMDNGEHGGHWSMYFKEVRNERI